MLHWAQLNYAPQMNWILFALTNFISLIFALLILAEAKRYMVSQARILGAPYTEAYYKKFFIRVKVTYFCIFIIILAASYFFLFL